MDFVSRAKLQQIIWCALCGSRNSFMVMKFNFLRFSIKFCNRRKRAQRLIKGQAAYLLKEERNAANVAGEIALQVCLLYSLTIADIQATESFTTHVQVNKLTCLEF